MTAALRSPHAITSSLLPTGIPVIRERFLARTGLFASSLDPDGRPGDPGLFGPDSATWSLVSQHCQPLAGLRAALLQSLSAPIPTATYSTGMFSEDFLGRVERTGAYVQAQNFGSMDEVHRSARRVRAMHRTIRGDTDGVRFDATDTHQTAWVSMTFTESILTIARRFGRAPDDDVADQFVREQAVHAALLDQRVDLDAIFRDPDQREALRHGELSLPLIEEGELATTSADLVRLMSAWTAELTISPLTRRLVDVTVTLEGLPPERRRYFLPFMHAVLHTVPDEWHELLAPDSDRAMERRAARLVQVPLVLMRAIVGDTPVLCAARARARSADSP